MELVKFIVVLCWYCIQLILLLYLVPLALVFLVILLLIKYLLIQPERQKWIEAIDKQVILYNYPGQDYTVAFKVEVRTIERENIVPSPLSMWSVRPFFLFYKWVWSEEYIVHSIFPYLDQNNNLILDIYQNPMRRESLLRVEPNHSSKIKILATITPELKEIINNLTPQIQEMMGRQAKLQQAINTAKDSDIYRHQVTLLNRGLNQLNQLIADTKAVKLLAEKLIREVLIGQKLEHLTGEALPENILELRTRIRTNQNFVEERYIDFQNQTIAYNELSGIG